MAALSAAPGAQADRPPVAELARRLQLKYETVRDFSADFVHVYEGGLLRKKVTERGSVLVKKPGRMRWTYVSPERKEFVSDGARLYSYVPQDRQVIVSDVPGADKATTPVMFLAGKGSLIRDFAVDYADQPEPSGDTFALKLVPHERQAEYDWLVLVVERESLRLRSLVTTDMQGGQSSLTFSRFRENIGLSDQSFVFKIPRGVDVIANAIPRR
jgi:outer membrane lipoprotein carrier protein